MGTPRGRSTPGGSVITAGLVVALAVVVLAYSAYLVLTFPPEAAGGSPGDAAGVDDATASAPSSSPTAQPEPEPTGPAVAVLGDGYTSGGPDGGKGDKGWPALLEQRVGVDVTTSARPATGYATGPEGMTFEDRAGPMLQGWDGGAAGDAVIVFGSRTDAEADPVEVQAAATRTLTYLARAAAPATVICIGPVWPTQAPPPGGEAAREAVRAAAQTAGVTFVDPQAEPWFSETTPR